MEKGSQEWSFKILLLTYTVISLTYGFSPQHLLLSVHIAVGQLSEQKTSPMSTIQSLLNACLWLWSVAHSCVDKDWLAIFLKMCYSSTHPSDQHPGMSLHVMSFTRPFPALILHTTNVGLRRPGYEAP